MEIASLDTSSGLRPPAPPEVGVEDGRAGVEGAGFAAAFPSLRGGEVFAADGECAAEALEAVETTDLVDAGVVGHAVGALFPSRRGLGLGL